MKQNLLVVGIELPHSEAAAARQPAKRIGKPKRQAGEIIEGEEMAVVSRDHQLAFLAGECSHRRGVRIDQGPEQFGKNGLRRALLARYCQQRIRAAEPECCQKPSNNQNEVVAV